MGFLLQVSSSLFPLGNVIFVTFAKDDAKPTYFLNIFLKGYLHYKTITSQNVSSEAQVKNFFIL